VSDPRLFSSSAPYWLAAFAAMATCCWRPVCAATAADRRRPSRPRCCHHTHTTPTQPPRTVTKLRTQTRLPHLHLRARVRMYTYPHPCTHGTTRRTCTQHFRPSPTHLPHLPPFRIPTRSRTHSPTYLHAHSPTYPLPYLPTPLLFHLLTHSPEHAGR
jgi:hypothetical protein